MPAVADRNLQQLREVAFRVAFGLRPTEVDARYLANLCIAIDETIMTRGILPMDWIRGVRREYAERLRPRTHKC